MKLSEAMRKGNAEIVDMHGKFLMFMDTNPCGCAVGSCLWGGGVKEQVDCVGYNYADPFNLLVKIFPQVKEMPACPVCGSKRGYKWTERYEDIPGAAIECLYENHAWTKERVLKWVEEWEASLDNLTKAGDPFQAEAVQRQVGANAIKAALGDITEPIQLPDTMKETEHGTQENAERLGHRTA